MERLLVAGALTLVAVAVALVVQHRRRPASVTAAGAHGDRLPQALDRADFAGRYAPWLIVVFSSATCQTCARVVEAAATLAVPDVDVVEVEWGSSRDLHRRYGIDAVPAVAITDRVGGVARWLLGPTTAEELTDALRAARAAATSDGGQAVQVRSRTEPPTD